MNAAQEISARVQAVADDASGETKETLDFYCGTLSDDFEKAVVAFAVAGIAVGAAMALLARVVPPAEMKSQMDAFIARCFRLPDAGAPT